MFKESTTFISGTPESNSTQKRRKKRLGVYFTPDRITRTLCDWAIRKSTDVVLEPSFGGCNFLSSAAARLSTVGRKSPWGSLYGCDIQRAAFEYLPRYARKLEGQNFLLADFLALRRPKTWPNAFNAVVGNPPYVSNHELSATKRRIAHAALKCSDDGIGLPLTASLWAYFVVHSVRYLAAGGRLALVLPRSLLDADYGLTVRRYIAANFQRSVAILVRKPLFREEGAEERTVCLLAENKGTRGRNGDISIGEVADERELRKRILAWDKRTWRPSPLSSGPAFSLLNRNAKASFQALARAKGAHKLGDYCDIRIGTVTGANKFFLFSAAKADELQMPMKAFAPIVSKSLDLGGLVYSERDFLHNLYAGTACLLLNPTKKRAGEGSIRSYLRTFPKELRASNVTFAKRDLWFQPSDRLIPDAFLPYMHDVGPRLCLNLGRSLCTNTIHRVFFKRNVPAYQRRAICVSMLTTFSQLSSELEGRTYGSGVLKHEPSEALNIQLALPRSMSIGKTNKAFAAIDDCIRSRDWRGARALADRYTFPRAQQKYLSTLNRALAALRLARRGHR
jgi:adenine-specific DNA-methyltransferase